MMRVAIFASAFYPHVGGVEELCRQLAIEYRRRGYEAIILTNRWPRHLPRYELYEGIPLYRLAMRVPEGNFRARFNYHLSHRMICRQMLDILRRHRIQLLHVQCVSSNGYYAQIAKNVLHLPLVVTAQGERTMDAAGIYQHSPFQNQVLKDLLNTADFITACSRETLADLENYFGQTFAGRSAAVYNGINLREFADKSIYPHSKSYFLAIGRHVVQKGFDILLRAYADAELNSHHILLAGDGPERSALQRLANQLRIQDSVHFIGRADRRMTVALFNGCDCFVLPSRMEPLGIVNLEAMAAGKAVIASRTGGVPEIVLDGKTGVLVPPGNSNALASALREIACDPQQRMRLGAAGRDRVVAFDWPKIADAYLDIYDGCLRSRVATSVAS